MPCTQLALLKPAQRNLSIQLVALGNLRGNTRAFLDWHGLEQPKARTSHESAFWDQHQRCAEQHICVMQQGSMLSMLSTLPCPPPLHAQG